MLRHLLLSYLCILLFVTVFTYYTTYCTVSFFSFPRNCRLGKRQTDITQKQRSRKYFSGDSDIAKKRPEFPGGSHIVYPELKTSLSHVSLITVGYVSSSLGAELRLIHVKYLSLHFGSRPLLNSKKALLRGNGPHNVMVRKIAVLCKYYGV